MILLPMLLAFLLVVLFIYLLIYLCMYLFIYYTRAKPCVTFGCTLCFAFYRTSAVLRDNLLLVLLTVLVVVIQLY